MKKPLTTLEYALLGLVQQRPISGYELCKLFETTPMGHYSSSPGSIYPALKRLEKRGLIEGLVERQQSLRPRRVYSLADKGLEELTAWATQPVTRRDIVWSEDEILLRFGFLDAVAGRQDICRFLGEVAAECETVLGSLEKHHRGMRASENENTGPTTGRQALGYGIASYRTLKRWANRCLAEYEESAAGK